MVTNTQSIVQWAFEKNEDFYNIRGQKNWTGEIWTNTKIDISFGWRHKKMNFNIPAETQEQMLVLITRQERKVFQNSVNTLDALKGFYH